MNDSISFTDPRQEPTSNGSGFYLPPVQQAALGQLRTALADYMDVSAVSDEDLYNAVYGLFILIWTTDCDFSATGWTRALAMVRGAA